MIVGNELLRLEPVCDWLALPEEVILTEAIGVAVDSNDRLVIFNRGEPQIIVVDVTGHFVNAWSDPKIQRPHGIWIAPDNALYLTDDIGHAVRQYTLSGEFVRAIGPHSMPSPTGAQGFDFRTIRSDESPGPYNLPTNVVTTQTGDIFVTDGYGNAQVHHFSADGQRVKSWGNPGRGRAQFQVPHGLGIDSQERLYVADRENSRIQIFSLDGKLQETWDDVVRPCQVFVSGDDLVFVAELGNWNGLFPWMERPEKPTHSRVSVFDQSGNLICRWGGHIDARQPDAFYAAHDIAVDSKGTVYVGEVARTASQAAGEPFDNLPTLRKFHRR